MSTKQPKVTRRKLEDYIPDDMNANSGSERGSSMLENSLQKVGAGRSLVADKDGHIVAGNKTLQAAVDAGITDVIEVESDGHSIIVHKRTDFDLSDKKGTAREYAYLDNRVGELSLNWDANVIAEDVAAGVDLSGMFYDWEIDKVVGNIQPEFDPTKLWIGMPEMEQTTVKPFHSMILHFKTEDDLKAFAKLVEQTINKVTKYIWYPKHENIDGVNHRVIDE